MYLPYPIIDAHAHIIEQIKSVGYRGEIRALGDGMARWANGDELRVIPKGWGEYGCSYEKMLTVMDENNIEKTVLLQGSLYGFQNEYSFEARDRYPDRFSVMASFDPYCLGAPEIMKRWIEEKQAKGLKFEMSVYSGLMGFHPEFRIDADIMRPVWECVADRGLVISLDIGEKGTASHQIDAIIGMAKRYPAAKIVLEHLFCIAPDQQDYLEEVLRKVAPCRNIYTTLASVLTNCGEQKPYPMAVRYVKTAADIIGTERIMWGTDLPITASLMPMEELKSFVADHCGFEYSDIKNIYHDTAVEVYSL